MIIQQSINLSICAFSLQKLWMLEGVTAFQNTKMKPLTTRQLKRLEKKKKKLVAFLEIAKLNDKDREVSAIGAQYCSR